MAQAKKSLDFWSDKRKKKKLRDIEIYLKDKEMRAEGGMKMTIANSLKDEFGVCLQTVYNCRIYMPWEIDQAIEMYPGRGFEERLVKIREREKDQPNLELARD